MKKTAATNTTVDTTKSNNDQHTCEHCGRKFLRPGNYIKHVCEQRRRWEDRDKPANRIGYNAWRRFYASCQPSKRTLEYKDFIDSMYYIAFVKFGTYCCDIRAVGVDSYVDHLVRSRTHIDSWSSDKVYTTFLRDYLKVENHYDAVKRSIEHLLDLAAENSVELRDVFRLVNHNRICHKIVQGHISPWLLYNSVNGPQFLSSLTDDHRALIYDYIDPEKWNIKFRRDPDAVAEVTALIQQVPGL